MDAMIWKYSLSASLISLAGPSPASLACTAEAIQPRAVARFLRDHPNVNFDLQTVHHDDLVRKLHERETDVAIAVEVPQNAPIGSRWLGEGELVVLYREADIADAPPRLALSAPTRPGPA